MSGGYEENISAELMKEFWWKKEWHSPKIVPRKVLNKLNRASAGVEVSKNKIESGSLQEIATVVIFLSGYFSM